MPRQDAPAAAVTGTARAGTPPAAPHGPYWRPILEDRWRARLAEVTELSLAYHAVTVATDGPGEQPDVADPEADPAARRLLRRTVAARRGLADVEEALNRLAAGRFGACEQCGSAIPGALLSIVPETRYCPGCGGKPGPAGQARPMWRSVPAGPGRR